ncbi:solute carrier family 35 member C2 isoform 2-T3 [Callospermophilus lateralis]|uniref:solute carrier family 35 member C2 isoform X2 n=1 Tax=Callospermophilus lateralis TaxID=76772 RepID=UPI004038AC6A
MFLCHLSPGRPLSPQHWQQHLTWACPTGASSTSPSRCEYRLLSAHLADGPATPSLSGTSPCSLSSSLAPSSSPRSLQPLPYTMTKSSAVLFILIFSLIFKLEELRAALVLVVLLIAGGLFMFTYKSTQFNVKGFSLVLGASFIGGIRWTLTQMLLQKAELGLQNPIDTMFHLQPLMFLGLFPLFAIFEGLHLSTSEKIFRFQDTGLLLRVLGSLFLGGILAFGLGFSEFLLVSRTSSLTLSIAGIFKEVCTLLLAAHLLGDQISLLNWLGFALCLSGISLHVALKTLHSRGEGGSRLLKGLSSSPDLELLLRSSQPEDEDNEEEDYFVAQGQQ